MRLRRVHRRRERAQSPDSRAHGRDGSGSLWLHAGWRSAAWPSSTPSQPAPRSRRFRPSASPRITIPPNFSPTGRPAIAIETPGWHPARWSALYPELPRGAGAGV